MIKKTGLKYSLSVFGTPPKTCYVHTENLELVNINNLLYMSQRKD